MPQCEDCQRPLESYESLLCRFCQARLFEWGDWPKVRTLFERIWFIVWAADPRPLSIAWHKFTVTTFEVIVHIQRTHQRSTSPASHVECAAAVWRAYFSGVRQYEAHPNEGSRALEFYMLLIRAIAMRRHYRRYLQQRFHFDVRRGKRRGPKLSRGTSYDLMLFTQGVIFYSLYEGVFHACLQAVSKAQEERKDLLTTLREAVTAMREALFQSMAEFMMRTLKSSLPWMEAAAMMNLSGWVRPQIRMYWSNLKALSEVGDPRTVLAECLPGWVWDATHNGVDLPSELLKTVRHSLDAMRQKSSRGARSIPQSQGQNSQRSRRKQQPKALETWQAQEEMRLDVSALKENAKLSPMESLVWELRQQGWKVREIAAERGVDIGTIKTEIFRIKAKLAKAQRRQGSVA
jgi:hypothetical protein